MTVNFPDSPTNAQTFTAGGKVFVYDNTKGIWKLQSGTTVTDVSGLTDTTNLLTSSATIYALAESIPSSAVEGELVFAQDTQELFIWDGSEWLAISSSGGSDGGATPTITSVSPANYDGSDQTTFTIIGTNFDLGTVVDFITSDGTEYRASATSAVTQGELTALTPQAFLTSDGPLDVKVTTNSGATVTASDVIQTGGAPVWTTPAGTLYENAFADDIASGDNSYRLESDLNETLVATDPEDQAVTYGIISGSLPPNGVLNANTGNISGSLPSDIGSDTTYSFLAAAYDQSGNRTDRTFNIIVKNQPGILYDFSSFEFTSGGASGPVGPTKTQLISSYNTSFDPWLNNTNFYDSVDGYQYWRVPQSGIYDFRLEGGHGGQDTLAGQAGIVEGRIELTGNTLLKMLVGHAGLPNIKDGDAAGGGGGTFVTFNDNTPIFVAGGGGGADGGPGGGNATSTTAGGNDGDSSLAAADNGAGGLAVSGGGGGGLVGDGQAGSGGGSGGLSFVNGGTGGEGFHAGGFGGGGGSAGGSEGGGGGGGYSGGQGGSGLGQAPDTGGGGRFYHADATNTSFALTASVAQDIGGAPDAGRITITFVES